MLQTCQGYARQQTRPQSIPFHDRDNITFIYASRLALQIMNGNPSMSPTHPVASMWQQWHTLSSLQHPPQAHASQYISANLVITLALSASCVSKLPLLDLTKVAKWCCISNLGSVGSHFAPVHLVNSIPSLTPLTSSYHYISFK